MFLRGKQRSLFLALELVILYLAYPISVVVGLSAVEDRWLVWLFTGMYVFFAFNKNTAKEELGLSESHWLGRIIFILSLIIALAVPLWYWFYQPTNEQQIIRLILIFIVYPVFSVPVQEFFFRTFFFLRYNEIMGSVAIVLVNSLLFSIYHLIHGGLLAAGFALLAGFVLSFLYFKSRDFLLCWAAHYIFGVIAYLFGFANHFTNISIITT